ncbi:MAG: CxxxxCH/CxxCH domain-containing protein [Deltaproteobacteria bacterium]|nr:CxxxxCH/CxxCH domain-containing protein [Deltaproteobacteria bacterium]
MMSSPARKLWFSTLLLWTLVGGCRVGGPEAADGGGDGEGEAIGAECSACHGGLEGNAAPPFGLDGERETSARAVGAHQSHLEASDWHVPVGCEMCHVVPGSIGAGGHLGQSPAELTWGERATTRGAVPSFDGTRCANVYCHGAVLLPGGSNTSPRWTVVDGTQAECGACHGLPPDPPHPESDNCIACHPLRFDDPTTYHVNGDVEVTGTSCNGCHGSEESSAPPVDTSGNTETSAVGVGAHQSHVATGSSWHADVACAECHVVPGTVAAPGHLDTPLPAELTFGPLAGADGSTPDFNGTTCTGVYCHGAASSGGSLTVPAWTTVDGTQAECGTCHGLPPTDGHPPASQCSNCHPSVVNDSLTIVAPALHVNGETNF